MDFAVIEGSRAGAYLLYVRTRGADETGERREINPAAHRYRIGAPVNIS